MRRKRLYFFATGIVVVLLSGVLLFFLQKKQYLLKLTTKSPITIVPITRPQGAIGKVSVFNQNKPLVLQTLLHNNTKGIFTGKILHKRVKDETIREVLVSSGIGPAQRHIVSDENSPLATGSYAFALYNEEETEVARYLFLIR